jgi:hypothetical protein
MELFQLRSFFVFCHLATSFAKLIDSKFSFHINLVSGCDVVSAFAHRASQSYNFILFLSHGGILLFPVQLYKT